MKILEDDFKCGQFWLNYVNIEPTNYAINSKIMIDSFSFFIENLMKPYTLDLHFVIFDEYYDVDKDLGHYHLTTDKKHIHSSSGSSNSIIKIVPEINSLQIIKLYDEVRQKYSQPLQDMVGIEEISCRSGLYYLPEKTDETEFIKYSGPGGPGWEVKRPIYKGIGIEAPLFEYNDVWAPIEIKATIGLGTIDFKTILNWSLYGKRNEKGFEMLKVAFQKLVDAGWTNNMPKNVF